MYSLGFYVQDEWKVQPNLTVTLALRMDRNSNINCARQLLQRVGHDLRAMPATP